ncbi:MAG: hypothetical protein WD066_08935 [Planctomycetaceae bacterium]
MGLWSTIKGWLNIGGVKVKIEDAPSIIHVGFNQIAGKAVFTSKSDKEVLSVKCQVVYEHKFKKNDEEKTETTTLGELCLEGFSLKADETRELPFTVDYHLEEKLAHMGGVMGAVGKLGAFASGSKDSYSLVVSCDVKGTVLDPSATLDLKVGKKVAEET